MKTTNIAFNFETPEASHGFLLWKLHAKWETGLKHLLKQHNLTHPQFVILATATWFVQYANSPTQQDLANRTGIDPMTTSVIIRGLIKKGYIERSPDTRDTRAYMIHITDIGESILQDAMNAVDAYDIRFFATLEKTESLNMASYMKKILHT